ncbi:hypothetical protein, conserved [Leishmania tarentolae]|uniref:Uncharacterized protein n=1 Tax=Leishmania tarentolae TaxID=5689 RepID=A0A640KV32_LEITA|nr:hypothetical protein, conserved [Leishmania tarentolae]
MGTSACDNSTSAAEAYALWGERIRLLFRSPPTFIEASLEQNPFERHSCCVPTDSLDIVSATIPRTPPEPAVHVSSQSVASHAGICRTYSDEALFPFCFYARLLQSQGTPSSMPTDALPGSACTSALMQTQQLKLDEEQMAMRLAARLRERTSLARARQQRLRDVPQANLVSPFCDPKVEKQQAQLHSEMTAFLLELRRENLASLQLRHQLQQSRTLHMRLHNMGSCSDSSCAE